MLRLCEGSAATIGGNVIVPYPPHCCNMSTWGGRGGGASGTSKLLCFVADLPMVKMKRLKGLTTMEGFPTFADITGSFGGASVNEDLWEEQLQDVLWGHCHSSSSHTHPCTHVSVGEGSSGKDDNDRPLITFMGDDTWVELFLIHFNNCHPFPSFNMRDLDMVGDGCINQA